MQTEIQKTFNMDLPAAMERNRDTVMAHARLYQVNVPGVGEWILDTRSGGPSCVAGVAEAPDLTMSIVADYFSTFMQDPIQNGMRLYFQGSLKLNGDQASTPWLLEIFSLAKSG